MKLKKTAYIILSAVFLFAGCGLNEGTIQKKAKSFLLFTGNIKNAVVQIDDLEPFSLEYSENQTLHEISPGKHLVIIKKSGKILVKRKVLLADGVTKEIEIP